MDYAIILDDANLQAIIDRIESRCKGDEMRQALGKACAYVERKAKEKAPKGKVKGGELRRSIKSRVEEENGDLVGTIYSDAEYAPYVEYGTGLFAENGGRQDVPWSYQDDKGEWHTTSGQKPQPFLRPALNENRAEIIRILKESISKDD